MKGCSSPALVAAGLLSVLIFGLVALTSREAVDAPAGAGESIGVGGGDGERKVSSG